MPVEPIEYKSGSYFDVEQPITGSFFGRVFDSKDPIIGNSQSESSLELASRDKVSNSGNLGLPGSNTRKMRCAPPLLRKFLAEFLGTFLLVIFGDGAIAQHVLGQNQSFLSICLGYGLGLMIGILVSGNVSGGHLNPAVTLAMSLLQKCTYICVPVYWAAQYLGAFAGATVLYGVYADAIEAQLGMNMSSAGIFASYPKDDIGVVTLIVGQTLGTGILLIIILAATDKKNMNVPPGLLPLTIGLGLTAIHISFAYNAGCAINPARDFSPRLLTYVAGFGNVFSADNYFFWIPWIMPHIGAVIGALTYYYFVEIHHKDEDDEEDEDF
ncbi:aquaporin-9-like isoform X1 [Tigriopus californicus]|uniref:aquaporin-9-like isoform X1 n=1 Tax=Tigriopus californicus TaxID=6832 RepID=UPI0027DA6418|nr:aquaporin-9-like isoform X1 [Tigriopus californicus]